MLICYMLKCNLSGLLVDLWSIEDITMYVLAGGMSMLVFL